MWWNACVKIWPGGQLESLDIRISFSGAGGGVALFWSKNTHARQTRYKSRSASAEARLKTERGLSDVTKRFRFKKRRKKSALFYRQVIEITSTSTFRITALTVAIFALPAIVCWPSILVATAPPTYMWKATTTCGSWHRIVRTTSVKFTKGGGPHMIIFITAATVWSDGPQKYQRYQKWKQLPVAPTHSPSLSKQ